MILYTTYKVMTRIIGHRGAAGLALENTMESFRRALEAGVDIVEFDVHVTQDKQFVVCHDPDLRRVSGQWALIKNLTYDELRKIKLKNGESVPLLTTVLELVQKNGKQAIVEMKANRSLAAFCSEIKRFDNTVKAVASSNYEILRGIRALSSDMKLYVVEHHNPAAALHKAKMLHAAGIDMNFWLLNPLTYWLARRAKLQFMVYTVNWRFTQRFIAKLYPAVDICTNVPHKFIEHASRFKFESRRP